jgi:hypothetical protein
MNTIHHLIKNKKHQMNPREREQLNKVLYRCYEKYAVVKAYEFKRMHFYKCKNIDTQELLLSSKVGLYKAIQRYNANYSFVHFSEMYIKSELLKTLTYAFSLSAVPKSVRMKSKKSFTKKYNHFLNPQLVHSFEMDCFSRVDCFPSRFSNHFHEEKEDFEKYREIWYKIDHEMKPFVKRILFLKFDYSFQPIRSNKVISQLMCVSEEMVRKCVARFLDEYFEK